MICTHVVGASPRLLFELSLRCDGGTSESGYHPKESQILVLRVCPPKPISILVFGKRLPRIAILHDIGRSL